MNIFLLKKTKELLFKKCINLKITPQIAVISGTGIKIFKKYKPLFAIKYNDLPLWSNTKNEKYRNNKIKGHEGILKLFKISSHYFLVFSGRKHLYEGLDIDDVIANIRLSYELGIKNLIVTNAAGGINKNLKVGELMLITGFLNFMQPTERGLLNNIVQPPKMINSRLTGLIKRTLIKKGVYAGVLGPSYETFSEIKLLSKLGADTVGMSTIPEIICSKSLGINFAAISVISNIWNKNHKPSHLEVVKHVNKASNKLSKLILEIAEKIR